MLVRHVAAAAYAEQFTRDFIDFLSQHRFGFKVGVGDGQKKRLGVINEIICNTLLEAAKQGTVHKKCCTEHSPPSMTAQLSSTIK